MLAHFNACVGQEDTGPGVVEVANDEDKKERWKGREGMKSEWREEGKVKEMEQSKEGEVGAYWFHDRGTQYAHNLQLCSTVNISNTHTKVQR